MKKLFFALSVCVALSAIFVFSGREQAKAITILPLGGVWTGMECYDCCGCNYPSKWNFKPIYKHPVLNIYQVEATRTSTGDVKMGYGIDLKYSGQVFGGLKHGCYGSSCGDCEYKFKGTVAGNAFSGSADYCKGTLGDFKHTRSSGNEVVPYSGGDANPGS